MAAQPASEVPRRRPAEAQFVPGPLGSRALRFGLRATLLAPLGAAAAVTVFADENAKAGSFVPLVVAITILGIAVSFLPWDEMAGSLFGRRVLHVWAGLDLVLITLAGWSTTGADLVLPLSYAVTIVFFAMVFPPRSQAVYLAATLASYLVVQLSTDFEFLPFAMLAILGGLSCFLSLELRRRAALHETARIESERRWSVVGAVATAARGAEASNPVGVLQGIVDAVALLGYASAAIHVTDGDGRMRVFLPTDIDDEDAASVRSLPDEIRSTVLEGERAVVCTPADADPLTLRALSASRLEALAAVPIVTGARPTGVLLAGTADRRGITSRETDALSMLAGHAALAVVRAQRTAEEREVAERLAAADRAHAEIATRLSEEARKPLAIVTETIRALKASEEGDRDRLLERLAAGATALDVTLGGLLDVSLLDVGEVPIDVQQVDLGALVTAVAGRLSGLFVDRELGLHAADGFVVEGDPALLERTVENLLVTAATSTAPGRAVDVAVSRADGKTTVQVTGDGTIPPELMARIGEPFDPSAGSLAGPVVRLALAAKILELHGTVLEVTSEPGRGTRVWFRLPGHRAPGRAAAAIAPFLADPEDPFVENALPVAVAAQAAFAMPPPPVEDEEDRERPPGHLGAAAAALATVASTMIVTGVVPDFVPQPHTVTTNAPDDGSGAPHGAGGNGSATKHHEGAGSQDGQNDGGQNGSTGNASNGSASASTNDGSGGSTGGTGTGATGGGTDAGGGSGGTGGGTPTPTPAPSPSPVKEPPGQGGSPGNSGNAPGHTKKSPSPSPSP
jgi:signal transduction histidine kinase